MKNICVRCWEVKGWNWSSNSSVYFINAFYNSLNVQNWPKNCWPLLRLIAIALNLVKNYLKVGLSPSKQKSFYLFYESLLKMIKNPFCFILKALFVLNMFKFLSWLFGYVEKNALIRKIRLISKLIASHPG